MHTHTATKPSSLQRTHWFYATAAIIMLFVMLAGFRHFYFQGRAHPGRDLTPSIRTLVIVHGTSMAVWVLVFLTQTLLITFRKRHLHMALGRAAAVFALLIVASGLWLSVASTRVAPPGMSLWAMTMKQFMAVSFFSIILFGIFVGIGVAYRKRADIHRPMMLLGTLCALTAAIARIDPVNALYETTPLVTLFGPFLGMLVLTAALLLAKCALTRSVDRPFAVGAAVLLACSLLIVWGARTESWNAFAGALLR